MINLDTVRAIEVAIDELAKEFHLAPGLLLNEDDLKCQLIAKLGRIGDLGVPVPSANNGVLATAVHAEVPWFDENDQLMLRPDITVTEPSELSIQRAMQSGIPLPRKGCHFIGNSVVIELKFYKGRDGVRPRKLPAIRKDINKIKRLVDRGHRLSPGTFLHGVVVVFGRYSHVCTAVTALTTQVDEHVTVIVRSAEL
jgi:hypothetical protein